MTHLYKEALDKNVIWDDKIAAIRIFQVEFAKCVKEVLTEASFTSWLKVMNGDYLNIEQISGQYLEESMMRLRKWFQRWPGNMDVHGEISG